jgi:hypothetical protein
MPDRIAPDSAAETCGSATAGDTLLATTRTPRLLAGDPGEASWIFPLLDRTIGATMGDFPGYQDERQKFASGDGIGNAGRIRMQATGTTCLGRPPFSET